VSPDALFFGNGGLVGCGTQAQPLTITITNETCAAFNYTSVLPTGSIYYAVAPEHGAVAPGQTQAVQVSPSPIPQVSEVTPDLYEGTLSITTTAPGDTGHLVQLHMTAYGAIVESSQFGSVIAFGAVPAGQTASQQFSVTNSGNAPTTISFDVGSQYYSVNAPDGGAPTFPIAPIQAVTPIVKFSPLAVQSYTDMMWTFEGVQPCSTPPAPIQLTGSGE